MLRRATYVPDGVPILSRGRHRNPRKGACFMEMASYLAGEKWSDHPTCTHPVLASMARCINDSLDEGTRQQLAPMIPEVVGLNPTDDRVPVSLVILAARAALPVAAAERQNIMALAILSAERVLAVQAGRTVDSVSAASRLALSSAPVAEAWARRFMDRAGGRLTPLRPAAASTLVALAIDGIARACVLDNEERLVQLLRDGIDTTRLLAESSAAADETATPATAPAVPRALLTSTDRARMPLG
ncbi:hypothetical protein N865_10555 [Intrasporangium oryzae NRRL B-24470]|uniref:Uncharacterized protein n=1 Tax=Intrasporangium oryzae NRRL B-24470 TaxID=1386089 RepID=W9GC55_9MICO|nr:hypothetical protein [Intrasporangium oryzae]EWT01434.1 hypothetical protein N865_10555 [Intrasporangium oryzae NRRL B-24470]